MPFEGLATSPRWTLKSPDFSDLPHILRRGCQLIIEDIVYGIAMRRAVDGGPQKRNAISTIIKKKHDHPLIGGDEDSPQLARTRMYQISENPLGMMISIRKKRSKIAVYVENLGYSFFGISRRADKQLEDIWTRYLHTKIREIFK